jgi:membrane protease YdiL (CAAX protease family)
MVNTRLSTEEDRLRPYIVLPIVVLLGTGILTYGIYYTLAAVRPEVVGGLPPGQVTFGLYVLIAVVEWVLAISIIRRLRRSGSAAMDLIAPQGGPWGFRWLPAVLVFLGLNALWVVFMAIISPFAGSGTYEGLHPCQRLLFVVMIPITAGFCEELIWRGYIITRLEARGRGRWATVLLAAGAFALIHGTPFHWIFTFVFGIVAGYYYVRERNLVPLMIAHAVVDLWSFGWYLLVLQ